MRFMDSGLRLGIKEELCVAVGFLCLTKVHIFVSRNIVRIMCNIYVWIFDVIRGSILFFILKT